LYATIASFYRRYHLPPILDRFKQLLIRHEISLGNLNAVDIGIMIVAASLATPRRAQFAEKEITERLARWLSTVGSNVRTDAVELRRQLVDSRCLERDAAGRVYTRSATWPDKWQEIASELESLDIESFADQVRTEEIERRAARKRAAMEKKDGQGS